MKADLRRYALHAAGMFAGIVLAMAAVALFRGAAFSAYAPAPPPGYLTARAPGYTLYAPDARALHEGSEEIEEARRTFRDRFGAEPGRLVVVLADSPAEFRALDLDALRRRDAGFLPFVTRAQLAAGARAAPGADSAAERREARFRAEMKTLGHEVCHFLISAHAGRAEHAGSGYGHAGLPDWIDEMAATLCESEASRARRRDYLRANLDDRIPLAELATMEHPVSMAVSVREAEGSPLFDAGTRVHVLRGEEAREFLRGMNARLFYAQALSLGEFVSARGGAAALRTLVEESARGRSLDEALGAARRRAPRLPASVEALEREWLAWFLEESGR